MADQNIINLGKAAKELLKSETFGAVVEELKREAFEKWRSTAVADSAAREDLYILQVALGHIREKLEAMRDSGRLEGVKLAHEEATREKQVTAAEEAVDE